MASGDVIVNFYSHIPCGMWPDWISVREQEQEFLLTHPLWDVTPVGSVYETMDSFLLTHPLWDVTCYTNRSRPNTNISTHTSLVGCDQNYWINLDKYAISTHTSLVGCDIQLARCMKQWIHFYSHIPCGMWQNFTGTSTPQNDFYSHIPCGMWRFVWG